MLRGGLIEDRQIDGPPARRRRVVHEILLAVDDAHEQALVQPFAGIVIDQLLESPEPLALVLTRVPGQHRLQH
jgi:hypothetical protein